MTDVEPTIHVATKETVETTTTPYVHVTTQETPDELKPVGSTTPAKPATATSDEPRELMAAERYLSIIKANPIYHDSAKVLHWRDPVKTGLIFGIFNFFFFLYTWADYSLLTIVSYLLLTLLAISFGFSNYVVLKASWLQGKRVENPFQERFKNVNFRVSREAIEKHADTVLDVTNTTIDLLREVFYCTDNFLSLRFVFYFYLGATVGNWFGGATLVYLAVLGFFIWPRLYEEKKKEIDHFYGIAKTQATIYFHLALSKLPPAVTARFPGLKPKAH